MKMPAGKYYVGDPAHVLSRTNLQILLTKPFNLKPTLIEFAEGTVWAVRLEETGIFHDQLENEYIVNSGWIGAVPLDLIDDPEGENNGTVINAENALHVDYMRQTGQHFLFVGTVVIRSKDEDPPSAWIGDEEDDELT